MVLERMEGRPHGANVIFPFQPLAGWGACFFALGIITGKPFFVVLQTNKHILKKKSHVLGCASVWGLAI